MPELHSMMQYHRTKLSQYLKMIQEEISNPRGYLPRIIYGFYQRHVFNEAVSELRQETDVDIITDARVVEITKDMRVIYKKKR